MFATEIVSFQKEALPDYDVQTDGDFILEFFDFGKSFGIPFFKNLGDSPITEVQRPAFVNGGTNSIRE